MRVPGTTWVGDCRKASRVCALGDVGAAHALGIAVVGQAAGAAADHAMQVRPEAVDAAGLHGVATGAQFERALHGLLPGLFGRGGRSRRALAGRGEQGHGNGNEQAVGAHGRQDSGAVEPPGCDTRSQPGAITCQSSSGRRRLRVTHTMFWVGSLMSQVLQCTQFCALICRRALSASPTNSYTPAGQ